MSTPHDVRHADQRAITNADQVELQAILDGFAALADGISDEKIAGTLDDLEVGGAVQDLAPELDGTGNVEGDGQELWSKQNVALDDEGGAILDEIKRRQEIMGPAYPFTVNGNTIEHQWSKSGVYEYCLGICFAPTITRKPFVKLPRSFERLSAILIQAWLSADAGSFHIGAPRYRLNGTTFNKAVDILSSTTSSGREWKWAPAPDYDSEIPRKGDEGLDFVVWRPSPDGRPGNLYIAGQCACGNDWDTKFNDLRRKKLESWIRPLSDLPFLRAFTTPFILSDGNLLVAQRDAGWTLDRIRLSVIADAKADHPFVSSVFPYIRRMFDLSRQAA